jgi:hypothetical protein
MRARADHDRRPGPASAPHWHKPLRPGKDVARIRLQLARGHLAVIKAPDARMKAIGAQIAAAVADQPPPHMMAVTRGLCLHDGSVRDAAPGQPITRLRWRRAVPRSSSEGWD